MYTLEDDQETSSRLRKGDSAGVPFTSPLMEDAGAGGADGTVAGQFLDPADRPDEVNQPTATLPRIFSPKQITSSFKRLTTPGKNVGGLGSTKAKRAAMAAMIVACVGVFLTAMDQTVVVTALIKIIADPGINIPFTHLDHAAWIISAYLLGFVIAMPLMGRVSDIYGRRRILILCLSIFGVGSVLCALAPAFGENIDLSFLGGIGLDTSSPGLIFLIAARFIQAIGGGAVVPVAMAIVSDFYGQERRGLALGIIGAVTEAGGVVGPLYGALIVQHLDWKAIFWFNVPIVIGMIIAAWFIIPKGRRLRDRIDWLGAALLGAALTCLSLGLAQQGTSLGPTVNGATPQNNPIALALSAVFLIAFILVERKVRHPVIDLTVFKRFTFSASSLVSLMVGAALIIAMADIPLFVDTVLSGQFSQADLPLVSGLALLRMTAMIPIGAFLGGWLCGRISSRFTGVLGLLFTACGFFLMSRWPMAVDWNQITISTITTGLGFGLVIAPISTTAINSVRPSQAGMGSAIVTSLRMVGMTLGLAWLTSWGIGYFKSLAAQYPSLPVTATSEQFAQWSKGYAAHLIASAHALYTAVFFITMVVALVAIVPAAFLWGTKPAVEEGTLPEADPAAPAQPGDPTVATPLAGTFLANAEFLNVIAEDTVPPIPPTINAGGGGRRPRRRRRVLVLASALLLLLLVGGGLFVFLTSQSPDSTTAASSSTPTISSKATSTPTVVSGPRMIELALDNGALTSIFVNQLGLQSSAFSNMQVTPAASNGIVISLDLHIDASGIHRIMPVELDTTIGIDAQQNIQLHVLHLKRDGLDAGPAAASRMENALNQLLISSVMPSLHNILKKAQLVAVGTSSTLVCGKGIEMLTILIKAPPIPGLPAQPVPSALCFKGPVDINKLLPS